MMRALFVLCVAMICGRWLAAEPMEIAQNTVAPAPVKGDSSAAPTPVVPGAPAVEQYALTIVQYEVSATPCAAETAMVEANTTNAGYACAVPKGRLVVNLKMGEPLRVADFMNRQITVAVEGKKENYLLVRVKIPGEMVAVFMPVIGGSFVAGYDLDEKKTKGVLLLIYVV